MKLQYFWIGLLVCVVASASAQEPTGLAALQGRETIGEQEQQQIRTFVSQQIGAIVGQDTAAATRATSSLRKAYDGTDAFKRALAEEAVSAIGSAYKKATLRSATQLLTALNTMRTPEAAPVCVDALSDDRVGVRSAGAIGLRMLRSELAAAGPDTIKQTLDSLVAAGKKEKSPEALSLIYAAMNYADLPNQPGADANTSALLDLLSARAKLYSAESEVRAGGAEDQGLRIALELIDKMDDAQKTQLTRVVATMMRHAIQRYATGPMKLADIRGSQTSRQATALRNGMERLIIVGEQILEKLLQPGEPPRMAEHMRQLELAEMKTAWSAWVRLLQPKLNEDFSIVDIPEEENPTEEAAG